MTTAVALNFPGFLPKCAFSTADNDFWLWMGDLGGCNANPASNSDAPEEIEKLVNSNMGGCGAQNACTFYTNVIQLSDPSILGDVASVLFSNVPSSGGQDISPGFDNITDYLMFYIIDDLSNYDQCLTPFNMNFYMDGARQVANLNKPTGSSIISYDMWGELILGGPQPGMAAVSYHLMDVTYGNCNTVAIN